MKEYISLRKWTLFSTSVYFGVSFTALILFDDLIDDHFDQLFIAFVWLASSAIWMVLAFSSFIYIFLSAKKLYRLRYLPFLMNIALLVICYVIAQLGIGARLEFLLKSRGYEELAKQYQTGTQVVFQEKTLPEQYRYLTRYSNQTYKMVVTRRATATQICFPLQPSLTASLEGVIYCSDDRTPTPEELPSTFKWRGDAKKAWRVKRNWFFYGSKGLFEISTIKEQEDAK